MNANELRLGNYGADINGRVFQLFVITEREQHWKIPNTDRNIETRLLNNSFEKFVFPIPLTEEWLLKSDKLNEFFMVDELGFVIFKNGYAHQFVRNDYKHVHSLQNLYFALTGEELTLKTMSDFVKVEKQKFDEFIDEIVNSGQSLYSDTTHICDPPMKRFFRKSDNVMIAHIDLESVRPGEEDEYFILKETE